MRAPRWFRDFCAWRWAPCVALIAGALLFIALVLLLIPQQLEPAARSAEAARTSGALADPPQHVVSDAPPEAPASAIAARNAEPALARAPSAIPTPKPAPAQHELTVVNPPDYASNITARADRPARSALNALGKQPSSP